MIPQRLAKISDNQLDNFFRLAASELKVIFEPISWQKFIQKLNTFQNSRQL